MAEAGKEIQQSLAPPVISALRQEATASRIPIERTSSMDIRAEKEDLKEAAEQSLNVVLDLGLDGVIRWVSPSWKDVVGTTAESVRGKPIANILLSRKEEFGEALESMKQDDSRSQFIRFRLRMGPASVLRKDESDIEPQNEEEAQENMDVVEQEQILNLEGQGIMVYDRSSGGESHVSGVLRLCGIILIPSRPCGCCVRPQSLGR